MRGDAFRLPLEEVLMPGSFRTPQPPAAGGVLGARRAIGAWVREVLGTLSPAEREEREVERLSKPAPSKKPPRRDLRRTIVKDGDLQEQESEDRDLSLNYKKVGGKVPKDKHPKEPGDFWQTDSAWGVWPKGGKQPTSAPDEETAKRLAEGTKSTPAAPAPAKKPAAPKDPGGQLRRDIDKVLSGPGTGDPDVRDALEDVLALGGKDFRKASQALLARIDERKSALLDNQAGWAAEAAAAAETALEESEDLTPEDLGIRAAELLFMDRVLTNPANLAGTPLSEQPLGAEDLEKRGAVAYYTFRDLTPDLRQAALDKAGAALESLAKGDPRLPELERIIDGLALACYLEGEDPVYYLKPEGTKKPDRALPREDAKGIFDYVDPADWGGGKKTKDPGGLLRGGDRGAEVSLRPPMSPSFQKLAQILDQQGEATALVMSPDDFYGPRGRAAITRALDQASDEELGEFLQDTPFAELGEALSLEHLGPAQRAALRDAIKQVSLEDMTTIQGLLAGLKKDPRKDGPESSGDAGSSLGSRLRKQAAEDAEVKKAVREAVGCLASGRGRDDCERAVTSLVLSGLDAFDKALERLAKEDGFQLDPKDPNLAKVRHVVRTGDLSILDQIVVRPESLLPLSGTTNREETTMSAKPAPLSRKAADEISMSMDRLANLITHEAEALGVSPKLAATFCRVADAVGDAIDSNAGIQRSPQQRQAAAQKTADFDPAQIGEEVAGPLEDGTPRPYMKGEWTHQEFREIGDLQEKGALSGGKLNLEPRNPDPGAQVRPLARSLRASVKNMADLADLGQVPPERLAQVEQALRLAMQVVEGKAEG